MPATPNADHTYFPYFDWLRFALATVVMLGHDHVMPWKESQHFAVHVFFALSGWLIGGILMDMPRASLPKFFFNRALRIWVPYYIACGLLLVGSLLQDAVTPKRVDLVVFKLLMVYNLFNERVNVAGYDDAPLKGAGHHFWSINAEEQFYLAAPLLLVVLWRFGGRNVLLWAGITVGLMLFSTNYPGLAFGVLSALVLKHRPWHRTRVGQCLLVAVLVLGAPFLFTPSLFNTVSPFVSTAIVLLLAVPGSKSPVGEVLGGMSYPLYLNHWIGIYTANFVYKALGTLPVMPVRQTLAVVVSVAIAAVHYVCIDRVIRDRRSAWYSQTRGLAVMAVAYAIFAVGVAYGAWWIH